jgi:hypothetical protein
VKRKDEKQKKVKNTDSKEWRHVRNEIYKKGKLIQNCLEGKRKNLSAFHLRRKEKYSA